MALPRQITASNANYIYGLRLTHIDVSNIGVSSGQVRDSTNSVDIVLSDDAVISKFGRGLGGIDTGTIQTTTLYNIFVVGSSYGAEETGVLFSLSPIAPVLPSNYDVFKRIGSFHYHSLEEIKPFFQYGNSLDRWMFYNTPQLILTNGTETDYTEIDASILIPTGQGYLANCAAQFSPTSASSTVYTRPKGSTQYQGYIRNNDTGLTRSNIWIQTNESAILEYRITVGGSLSLSVTGYLDTL